MRSPFGRCLDARFNSAQVVGSSLGDKVLDMVTVDIDNDNDIDIIASTYVDVQPGDDTDQEEKGILSIYENVNNEESWLRHDMTISMQPGQLGVGKINADDLNDIVIASDTSVEGNVTLVWLANLGNTSFDIHIVASHFKAAGSTLIRPQVFVGDVNQDGNTDILCTQLEDGVNFFEGHGA